jgi:hypothetical protein
MKVGVLMPSVINLGSLNVNTPQQNSSVFVGETVITGMDTNQKYNVGRAGKYGFFCTFFGDVSINLDGMEIADGNINDQDVKPNFNGINV